MKTIKSRKRFGECEKKDFNKSVIFQHDMHSLFKSFYGDIKIIIFFLKQVQGNNLIQRSAEYIFVNNILCLCRFSWIKSPVSNYYSYYIRRFPFHLFDELPILSYYCNNTILKFHRTRTSSYSTISSSHRYGLIVFYTFVCIFSANNII